MALVKVWIQDPCENYRVPIVKQSHCFALLVSANPEQQFCKIYKYDNMMKFTCFVLRIS